MLRALRATPVPHLRAVAPPRVAPCAPWIELTIAWGDTTLLVAHLRAGERFVLGDAVPPGVRGFVAPGAARELLVPHGALVAAVVPDLGRASFFEGGRVRSGREVLARGAAVASTSPDAPHALFPLTAGSRCRWTAEGLTVQIAAVGATEPVGRGSVRLRRSHWAILAVSLALHALIVAAILGLPSVDSQAAVPATTR